MLKFNYDGKIIYIIYMEFILKEISTFLNAISLEPG